MPEYEKPTSFMFTGSEENGDPADRKALEAILRKMLGDDEFERSLEQPDLVRIANEYADHLATSKAVYAIAKAHNERRYTFGPMYMPDTTDAHGEWVARDDLQESLWDYVRATGSDRRINLQHSDLPAGEWVEVAHWPYETEVELVVPPNSVEKGTRSVTLPAGTTFMGVVWEPWAWELVKQGKLRGLSMGGRARKVEADFGGEDEP